VREPYHAAQRELQDRFDTRRLADRLAETTSEGISEAHRAFIEAREMFLIATADAHGWPEVSYKGGAPGFVRVLDERTLAFPMYDGNGMYLTVGNLVVNPRAGLLFIDLERGTRLRVNGEASIDWADPLLDTSPGAQLIVRVTTAAVFANCRRYVHRYQLLKASPFVPEAGFAAPVPDWKRDAWFDGTLPEHDPARDPEHPSAPAIPEF
jgi:uncharacterized protein